MRILKKDGISEAKKAPFNVAVGTEAFLASESNLLSAEIPIRRTGRFGFGEILLILRRQREPELLTGASGFAVAHFES